MRKLLLLVACGVLLAHQAQAVTIDWVPVGDPGNLADTEVMTCCTPLEGTTGFGSVPYTYWISKYEITNAQYAEFANAVAASDPYALYNESMGTDSSNGGINRTGSPGSYSYTVKEGFASKPVTYVSFYDVLRFANWLNNGQGSGDTETGAYTLLGGTATPSNGTTVTRNTSATIFLTSEDEWYKAAYFNGTTYFDYPAGFDAQTACAGASAAIPNAWPNTANCN